MQQQRFGNHVFEPVWRQRRELFGRKAPHEISEWLFDEGSLTKRVQQHCCQQFSVKVLSQTWHRPMLNEAMRLNVRAEQHALIRQVLLYCGDTPWVFARTVIPLVTLTGPQRFLASLGNRPLGAVLFADPSIVRDEMEVACIQPGQRMFASATACLNQIPDCIWGRRSVFYLQKKPLLVNEVFLPTILQNV